MVLPACVAWIVQVPAATSVTVVPDTVQTGVVCELKLTVSPELAVALTVNGAVPSVLFESVPNVMVWDACVITRPETVTVEMFSAPGQENANVLGPRTCGVLVA